MRKIWLASPFVVVVGGVAGCPAAAPVATLEGGGDTGIAGRDTREIDTGVIRNPPPPPPPPPPPLEPDRTTGKICTADEDCDVTGNGLGHCTNKLYIVSPLHPTSHCIQIDFGGDACDPGDGSAVALCDGGLGLCVKHGTSPAICQPFCTVDDTGKPTQACQGKNACHLSTLGVDTAGRHVLFGACEGGCATDDDCPSDSVCDPVQAICSNLKCTTDDDCAKRWPKAPPRFGCVPDTSGAASHCRWSFAKKDGEACTPGTTTSLSKDCLCLGKSGGPADSGVCASICKTVAPGTTNPECAPGFVCDPLLLTVGADGKTLYDPMFTLPASISGWCVRTCSVDADCGGAGFTCAQSAGMPGKTCRPPG